MKLNLPPDPKDLTTDYEVKQSDLDWTKENVIDKIASGMWVTSSVFYFIAPSGALDKKAALCVAAVFDNLNLPSICVEDLSRAKKVFELLGWGFGYDSQLGKTMKMDNDHDKFNYLLTRVAKDVFELSGNNLDVFIKKSSKNFNDLIGESFQPPFQKLHDFKM